MQQQSATIRRLVDDDRPDWFALWQAYCDFYRTRIDAETSATTFSRLCAGDGMVGLVAEERVGAVVGFAHLVLHKSTWATTDCCYLEDLYVVPQYRGSGVAKQLVTRVYAEADACSVGKVYWHTQEFNAPARSLYDTLARRTSLVVYRR